MANNHQPAWKPSKSWILLLAASIFILILGLIHDMNQIRSTSTYGNFDVPGTESWIMKLSPGISDMASNIVYGEFHIIPLIFIGVLFIFMMAASAYRNMADFFPRIFVQWSMFAIARMGVLRVSGLCPFPRTAFGSFNFLNCQACEMATGACPIGMFQWSLMNLKMPLLVLGALFLSGVLVGRGVCGWMCPFGYISDIFDRVSLKKYTIDNKLIYLKFFLLAAILSAVFWPHPIFCAYLCPSGVIYGLLPYYLTTGFPALIQAMSQDHWIISMLGYHMFAGFIFILGVIMVSGRWFCRYLCPLGACYGLFNYISPFRVIIDKQDCNSCGLCKSNCPMDVDLLRASFLDITGCIKCGRCIKACKRHARFFSIKP